MVTKATSISRTVFLILITITIIVYGIAHDEPSVLIPDSKLDKLNSRRISQITLHGNQLLLHVKKKSFPIEFNDDSEANLDLKINENGGLVIPSNSDKLLKPIDMNRYTDPREDDEERKENFDRLLLGTGLKFTGEPRENLQENAKFVENLHSPTKTEAVGDKNSIDAARVNSVKPLAHNSHHAPEENVGDFPFSKAHALETPAPPDAPASPPPPTQKIAIADKPNSPHLTGNLNVAPKEVTEAKTDTEIKPQTEGKPEITPEARPDTETKPDRETKPDASPKKDKKKIKIMILDDDDDDITKTLAKLKGIQEVQLEGKTETKTEAKTEAKPEEARPPPIPIMTTTIKPMVTPTGRKTTPTPKTIRVVHILEQAPPPPHLECMQPPCSSECLRPPCPPLPQCLKPPCTPPPLDCLKPPCPPPSDCLRPPCPPEIPSHLDILHSDNLNPFSYNRLPNIYSFSQFKPISFGHTENGIPFVSERPPPFVAEHLDSEDESMHSMFPKEESSIPLYARPKGPLFTDVDMLTKLLRRRQERRHQTGQNLRSPLNSNSNIRPEIHYHFHFAKNPSADIARPTAKQDSNGFGRALFAQDLSDAMVAKLLPILRRPSDSLKEASKNINLVEMFKQHKLSSDSPIRNPYDGSEALLDIPNVEGSFLRRKHVRKREKIQNFKHHRHFLKI